MNYIYTNDPIEQSASAAADAILEQLSTGKRVLWLLSGGSGAAIAIAASKKLQGNDLTNLFVTITDERYGPVGHKDENWQQLLDAGLELPRATLYRPLFGQDKNKTTSAMNAWIAEHLESTDYRLGIFGFGTDGHTAGIKPNSPAATSRELVASFTGDDFERITITFEVIKKLDEAIIQASGADKRSVIRSLLNDSILLNDQPAQILKTIPLATLYTNNKMEEL